VRRMAFCLCVLALGINLTGCAGLFQTMENPRINIANIAPKEIKLFEQVFDVELRIQNPNDSPLPINGLELELQINDKRFATGVSNQNVTVDRLSSAVIHVEAVTSLWGVLRQVAEIQNTRTPQVRYRIKGRIFSDSPSMRLSFDDSGEIKIPLEPSK
jgi:LEA14-like dessication related protein